MAQDIFISHSSKDKVIADAVCHALEARGIRCWIAPRDIRPGEDFAASIVRAISGSRFMVLIFSLDANSSPHVLNEVSTAMKKGVVIVPFRIHDVPLSDSLEYYTSRSHWLDAVNPPLDAHLVSLSDTIEKYLAVSPPPQDASGRRAQLDEETEQQETERQPPTAAEKFPHKQAPRRRQKTPRTGSTEDRSANPAAASISKDAAEQNYTVPSITSDHPTSARQTPIVSPETTEKVGAIGSEPLRAEPRADPVRGDDRLTRLTVLEPEARWGVQAAIEVGGRKIPITVPPAAQTGEILLSLAGLGEPGLRGGEPGSLVVSLQVERFEREKYEDPDIRLIERLLERQQPEIALRVFAAALSSYAGVQGGETWSLDRALACMAAAGKVEEALQAYRQYVGRNPRSTKLQWDMAAWLKAMGRPHEAITEYRRLVRAAPGRLEAWTHSIDLLSETGQSEAAVAAYRDASTHCTSVDVLTTRLTLDQLLLADGQIEEWLQTEIVNCSQTGSSIGIDLGSANCSIAYVDESEPVLCPSEEGAPVTEAVVRADANGRRRIGRRAWLEAELGNPNPNLYDKRSLGRAWWELPETVNGATWFPALVPAAALLRRMALDAISRVGRSIGTAVITLPACLSEAERYGVAQAARMAGIEKPLLLHAGLAVAAGWVRRDYAGTITVLDLGAHFCEAGSFDVGATDNGTVVVMEEVAISERHLGGSDWDARIMNYAALDARQKAGIDLRTDASGWQRLRLAADKARIDLSTFADTNIELPYLSDNSGEPYFLARTLTRAQLEEMTQDLVARCRDVLARAMDATDVYRNDAHEIVLSGGAANMPAIQKMARELARSRSGNVPVRLATSPGLAARGAARVACSLGGSCNKWMFLRCSSAPIGVETMGGVLSIVMPRNKTMPARRSETFTSVADGQTTAIVRVYEGENEVAAKNLLLAAFRFTGLPPGPRGSMRIEIAIDLDTYGAITVTAIDRATERSLSFQVSGRPNEEPGHAYSESEAIAEWDGADEDTAARSRAQESDGSI